MADIKILSVIMAAMLFQPRNWFTRRRWFDAEMLAAICIGLAQFQCFGIVRDVTTLGALSNGETDDTGTIQNAINSSDQGDTVYLPTGTFLISRTLRVKSGIKIHGAGRDRCIMKLRTNTETDFFDLSGARNVEISGFTIEGGPNARHGIFGHTGSGHFIHGLTIENLGSSNGPLGIFFTGDGGGRSNGVTDCIISDNLFRNIGLASEWGGGIRLSWGSSRNQVLRNVVDNTGRGGIFANDGSTDLIISSNTVTRSGRKAEKLGIEIWGNCDRGVIEDNRIDHWLSISGTSHVAARRNSISGPPGDVAFIGLELIGQDIVATDNLVEGSQQIGVSVSNNASNQWHYCAYNTIRNVIQWGAQLQGDNTGARMLYYYRNKFLSTQRGNPAAIYPGADGRGFRFNGNCQQITLDANEIGDNPAEGIELGGSRLDQLSIVNNTISGNGFAAVSGNPGIDLEWVNNTVTGNGKNNQLTSRGFTNRKPVASFTCLPKASVGQRLDFTNKSAAPGGSIAHVLWDFGDGVPSTLPQSTHSYSRAGSYRVTFVVWDNHGRGAIEERTLLISQ
jgi:hypothetical protein